MKKIMALVLALALVLASCAVAFADEGYPASVIGANVSITVGGIREGDVLDVYKIGTPVISESNELSVTWNPTELQTLIEGADDEGSSYAANAPLQAGIANLIKQGKISVTANGDAQQAAGSDGTATVSVTSGYYLAIVKGSDTTPNKDAGVIYQNMLINALPVPGSDGKYVAHEAIVKAQVKKTTTELKKEQKDAVADPTWTVETVDGYKLGDTIPFKITTNIPNYPNNAKYATFEITDTPAGLKINPDSITVKVGAAGSEATVDPATTITPNNTYSASETFTKAVDASTGKMTIVFDKEYILQNPGASVIVEYNAELIGDGEITIDEVTHNHATIKYNRNPDEDTTYEPPTDIQQESYSFTFIKYSTEDSAISGSTEEEKVASANANLSSLTALSGAEFSLFTQQTGGTAIQLIDLGNNVYRPATSEDTGTTTTTIIAGTSTIIGLGDQDYFLQEDKAPAGFAPMAGRLTVHPTKDTSEVGIDYGVPNTPGSTLPETGGIGTTIFYILGGLLVVGAAVILVARRKAQD